MAAVKQYRGVAGARITVGAEVANVRQIGVQLLDRAGRDISYRAAVRLAVLADANGDAFVAVGGTTGLAIGAGGDGTLIPLVAKKLFEAISEADGDIDLQWTDTGTDVAYLAVILPNGAMVISAALTNT